MSRKAFHIGIDIDIHAVSCPGVWLCPKGDAMLRVSMLGSSVHTKRVEPSFPLLFHESFHFRKTFTGVTSLAGLQSELTKRLVHLQLVQWQVHGCRCVLLAAFRSPLTELLYPQPATRGHMAGVDVDLLMETTTCFPGIIAPKVEVSTKVVIEEMVNYQHHKSGSVITNHRTLSSKNTSWKKEDKQSGRNKPKPKSMVSCGYRSRVLQKPVCHTRQRVKCYCCKHRVRGGGGGEPHCSCQVEPADTHYLPYCNNCGDHFEENGVKRGKIILKENSQHPDKWEAACPCVEPPRSKSACDCNLCRKYYSLFNNSGSSVAESSLSQNVKSAGLRYDRSPSPSKKEKCCPCVDDKPGDNIQRATKNYQIQSGDTRMQEYRDIFKADLDSHYKKLYERVSRRNNRKES